MVEFAYAVISFSIYNDNSGDPPAAVEVFQCDDGSYVLAADDPGDGTYTIEAGRKRTRSKVRSGRWARSDPDGRRQVSPAASVNDGAPLTGRAARSAPRRPGAACYR